MTTLLAATPVLAAMALLGLRVRSSTVGVATLATAVLAAVLGFGATAADIGAGVAGIAPVALEIAGILFFGILLNQQMSLVGAHRRIAAWVEQTFTSRSSIVLAVVLGFCPFAESVTGFGIGFLVALPILQHLQMSPVRTAVLGLIGLVAAPWGALAPGMLIAAELTGVDFQALGVRSAVVIAPILLVTALVAITLAEGRRAWRHLPKTVLAATALAGGILAANVAFGTSLAGALGSLLPIVVLMALSALSGRRRPSIDRETVRAAAPYMVIIAGLLACNRVVALTGVDGAVAEVITSPAVWLGIAALTAYPGSGARRLPTVRAAATTWTPVAVATLGFVTVGAIMAETGMSAALVQPAADWAEPVTLALVPGVGGLGGFLTASTSGANAMFAATQAELARLLGVQALHTVSIQNVSAAAMCMASLPRVALAAAMVGKDSAADEGELGRRVMGAVLAINVAFLVVLSVVSVLGAGR